MNWFRKKALIIIGVGGLAFLSSCSNLKYLPKNEILYTGAKVKVEGVDKKKQRKLLEDQLEAMVRPRPNSKILGLRIKLYAWNIAGNPKKKNSPAGLLKKFGEPPVLLSQFSLDHNINVMRSDLENRGYFRAEVTGDTIIRNQKAKAEFLAVAGPRYTINKVFRQQDSSELQKAINRIPERWSLLKEGDPFDLNVVKAERERIDAILKQRGFYFFSSDHLIVEVDSTIGDNKVNLYVNTKQETPADARRTYSINDIYIFTDFNLGTAGQDTHVNYAKFYKGYYLIDRKDFYKPKLFEQAIQFEKGDIYNRRDHNNTLSRLINLGIFKFVQNRFAQKNDTALNAYYYITPMPRKSIRAELGGHTKSNNLTGSQLTLGFTNRNTFKGGEILTVEGTGGFEVQVSGSQRGFNTFRIGAEANLAVPRFITPFFKINTRGGFVPRTNFKLGYDILNRQKLYTLNSFRGGMGYIWKESIQKEHQFYPISVQYVQPVNVTQLYLDSLVKDINLQKAIDTQFILGAYYNYNFNQLAGRSPRNAFYFNGLVDVSGNIAGLVMGADAKASDPSRIFNAPFSQYTKLEADLRFYKKLGDDRNTPNVWASRVIVGAGFPYGNSVELPFIKQFFIGGNNSLRGFRSRTLGPGTYQAPGLGTSGFIADQSGDMKLEINSELRMKLFSIVHGAVFVDAGNIWLKNENPNKPGSKFSSDFLKELAANAGLGIRLDISILVLRLDVAFPIRKPYLPESERWVIEDINFGDPDWRKENIIFNLGIGYPF